MPADTVINTSVSAIFQQDGMLNSNGYFEKNIDGWSHFNGTSIWSQTQAHEGTGSLFFTPVGGQTTGIAQTLPANSPTVIPGKTYTFYFWMRSTLDWPTNEAVLTWLDANNAQISNSVGTSIPHTAGVWVRHTLTAQAPAGAVRAQMRARKSGTPPNTQTFYIDEAFLVESDRPDITTARARISPQVYGVKWQIERIATTTTSAKDTELRIYRGDEQPNRLVDSSYSGNLDTSDTKIVVETTEQVIFVWSRGTPGSVAYATIDGKQLGR
jgi:Carbohydrate binding domain